MNNKKVKEYFVCFDTEFTGLRKDTSLISIGMIDNVGRTLYIEIEDYDKNQIDEWTEKNVISNLIHPEINKRNKYEWVISCKKNEAYKYILSWLKPIVRDGDRYIQFVSDVSHYDMVLLLDLLIPEGKTAIDIPSYISPYCIDINQEISLLLGITAKEAFDINRENFVYDILSQSDDPFRFNFLNNAKKHNSLFDARVIKYIHDMFITRYKDYKNIIDMIQ